MTCCRNFWRQSGTVAAHSLVTPAMCCKSSSAARRERVRSQMPLCAMFAPRLVCSSWTDRIGTIPGLDLASRNTARDIQGRCLRGFALRFAGHVRLRRGHPDIVTTHWPIRADLMTQPDLSAWSDLVDEPASLISRLAVSLARNFYAEICFYMVLVATLAIGLSIHLLRGRDIRSRYFSRNFRVDATYALLDVLHVSHFLVILPASIFIGELLRTTFPWLRVEAIASLPAWLQLFCLFVANDFCAYWLHRLHHGNPVFWQFHKTHHSQQHLSELTVFRVTVLDRLFDLLFLSLPLAVMGVGATAPIVMVTILQAHQLLIHSDTALSLGLLDRILVTPSFHEVHHSTAREHL